MSTPIPLDPPTKAKAHPKPWKHTLAVLASVAGTVGPSHLAASNRLDAIEAEQQRQGQQLARLEGEVTAALQLHAKLEPAPVRSSPATTSSPPAVAVGTSH